MIAFDVIITRYHIYHSTSIQLDKHLMTHSCTGLHERTRCHRACLLLLCELMELQLQGFHTVSHLYKAETCRETVLALLHGNAPSDKASLRRLQLHGYIQQQDKGQWTLRVPLFRLWIEAFYLD